MNRRSFLKSSALAAMSTTVLGTAAARASAAQPAHVWDRPLHTVYAGGTGKFLDNTDKVLLNAFDQVSGGITAMTPFLLNVKDPSPYATMINAVQANGTVIVPGIGKDPSVEPIDSQDYKDMAKAYRDYTNYVRLENMQGFMDLKDGQAHIQNMIDYLTGTLGFAHVMLNPWPKNSNGDIVPFKNPELDASFNNVQLNFDRTPPYAVHPDPTNWLVNMTEVNRILAYRSTVKIVVNYESAPQHEALYYMELNNPGSSKPAMNITANQCQDSPGNLFWCPPFTQIYDPIDLGTWTWISNRLGQMP
jgi:hypothetical protein